MNVILSISITIFYAMNTTKICSGNSAAIRLPDRVFALEIQLPPNRASSSQAPDLHLISGFWGCFSGAERVFSAVGSGKDEVPQSGKSKNLHQPFGLMSPATTWQDRSGRNRVQAAQARPPFGRS
jgi:hypothetical protein